MFAWILVAGLGLPLPEDVAMISGGILAHRGITDLYITLAVLSTAVLIGDSILFFVARRIGAAIYKRKWMQRVMTAERRQRIEQLIERYGALVVFGARHVAGLRGAIFAMCAIHGISYIRFIVADALALALSLPLFFGIGWWFSDSIDRVKEQTASLEHWIMAGVAAVALVAILLHGLFSIRKRPIPHPSSLSDGPANTPQTDSQSPAS
ncbi:MAG: DedA family protein [Sandaracinaceae bacterium]|nr:DedA family protein [Sandaracinaceae bacterium]MDW8245942.1 DedA family protein [Sandaracinaceae bacterium]